MKIKRWNYWLIGRMEVHLFDGFSLGFRFYQGFFELNILVVSFWYDFRQKADERYLASI